MAATNSSSPWSSAISCAVLIFAEQSSKSEREVSRAIQNQGTFSAAQALQFGPGNDVQRKIAGSSEETARNTGRLIRELPAAIAKSNRLSA